MRNPTNAGPSRCSAGRHSDRGRLPHRRRPAATPAIARPEDRMNASPHAVALAAYSRMTKAQRIGQLFMAGVAVDRGIAGRPSLLRQALGRKRDSRPRHDRRPSRRASRHEATDASGARCRSCAVHQHGSGRWRGATADRQGLCSDARPHWRRAGCRPAALRARQRDLGPRSSLLPASTSTWRQSPTRCRPSHAASNQPIGQFDREYGHSPEAGGAACRRVSARDERRREWTPRSSISPALAVPPATPTPRRM